MSRRLRATPWFRSPHRLLADWAWPVSIHAIRRTEHLPIRSNIHARPRTLTWAMLYEAAYGPMARVLFEPLRGTPLYPFDK